MTITRFAPSPTGLLHVGNVRTALVNWLYTKAKGGKFILRMDDTDAERSREEYVKGIKEDLTWLGLAWDDYFHQSHRLARYEEIKQKLLKEKRLYPCFETAEELEIKRKMRLSRGLPPIYDREALKLSTSDVAALVAQGKKPHWRFLLDDKPMEWEDGVRGHTHFEAKHMSDPVLIRADGTYTYMMPSTVDDMDYGVTQIIRGEDHVTNTAIQIQIFRALGATIPGFGHLALVTSKDASISKRTGGFDIRQLREDGILPMAISSFLSKLGTSQPVEARVNLQELAEEFNLSAFGRAPTNYDIAELERINARLLQLLSYDAIKEELKLLGLEEVDAPFWEAVKTNITRLRDIKEWWHICKEPITPVIEDKEFAAEAETLLPGGTWDETTWGVWVASIQSKTGRKGKALFMPLRKALTAREHGPELKIILPLLGKEKVEKRLKGVRA